MKNIKNYLTKAVEYAKKPITYGLAVGTLLTACNTTPKKSEKSIPVKSLDEIEREYISGIEKAFENYKEPEESELVKKLIELKNQRLKLQESKLDYLEEMNQTIENQMKSIQEQRKKLKEHGFEYESNDSDDSETYNKEQDNSKDENEEVKVDPEFQKKLLESEIEE